MSNEQTVDEKVKSSSPAVKGGEKAVKFLGLFGDDNIKIVMHQDSNKKRSFRVFEAADVTKVNQSVADSIWNGLKEPPEPFLSELKILYGVK